MKRLLLAVGLLLLLSPTPARAATVVDVGELNSTFRNGACPSPAGNNITTVKVGDSVRWTNCDTFDHNIKWADETGFSDPPVMHPGEFVVQAFSRAGFFYYSCEIHSMTGEVIVQGVAASTTRPTAPPQTTTTALSFNTAPTTTPTTATLGNVFVTSTTDTTEAPTTTTIEPDSTPIKNKDGGANAGLVALTVVGIGAVVAGGFYVVRRMRALT